MTDTQAAIISKLKKDIFPLEGFKNTPTNAALDLNLGLIKNAFPNHTFPLGAIHEFISSTVEDATATYGFVAGLLAPLMQKGGAAIWISNGRKIFLPALKSFGIAPDKIIFIDLKKEKEMLWAMEEALKCEGLSAVIGEIPELSFTASRRLQLAVEDSQVTGFMLRNNPRTLSTTACVTRWKITHIPSELLDAMPGVGFPRWNIALLKVRNGKPGSWQVEFNGGRFRHLYQLTAIPQLQQKTG